uniref:Transforming acidic coiled-coil-containing protein C-terminal domain-containing protein n=4 Tax=Lygus hesperus TaxID=30085 RepID=A0A0K8SMS4_LYGHE
MGDNHQISGEEGKLNITPPSHSESDERIINITPTSARKENLQSGGGYTPILRQEISKLQELMIQQEQAHQEKTDLVEQLRSRIAELEMANSGDLSDSRTLEQQLKAKDDELKLVHDELEKSRVSNKQLVQVMEEYEKTISQLVTVKEETKAQMEKDKETIAAERDTALQHLSNMEVAFNDIHQKYERAKTVIETLHANEKELKKSYDAVVETVEAQNTAYQKLKQHAAEKLSAANAEIEKIHKEYNGEMARMKAVARKNELKCKSLEESLEQKKKELRELTQICDELIGKVTCQS